MSRFIFCVCIRSRSFFLIKDHFVSSHPMTGLEVALKNFKVQSETGQHDMDKKTSRFDF